MDKNLILILSIIAGNLGLLIFGWFYTPRSRRLAQFALMVIVGGIVLLMLCGMIQRTIFPGGYIL